MNPLHTLHRFVLALGLAAMLGVLSSHAQTATIGYDPVANLLSPTVLRFNTASLRASNAYVVPFQFNSLGDYSLTSVKLLLAGNADLADFSLSVSSTLPTNLTPPSALIDFSTTGTLSSTESAYTFTPSATPTLAANTTYYYRVAYTGGDTANWILSGGTSYTGSGSTPSLTFIESAFAANTLITYRSVTSGGSSSGSSSALFTDNYGNVGAFSITASAVSAIPEPSTYAAIAGALTLAAAIVVRRRRQPRSNPAA